MTYKSALEWAENNLPLDDYDNFDDWYSAMINQFQTPELTNSDVFKDLSRDEWLSRFGKLDRTQEEPEEEPEELPEQPSSRITEIETPRTIGAPRIVYTPREALTTEQPKAIVLPPTGQAPSIPKPVLLIPRTEQVRISKPSLISRIKSGFGRLNPFRRKK